MTINCYHFHTYTYCHTACTSFKMPEISKTRKNSLKHQIFLDYWLHPDWIHGLGDGDQCHSSQVPERRYGEWKKLDYQLIAGTNYVCLVLELLCDHAGLQPVFLWSGWLGGGRKRVHLSSQVRRATQQLHQRKIMNHEKMFRLFLVMIVLCMAAEIGGIIALTVFEKSVISNIFLGNKY